METEQEGTPVDTLTEALEKLTPEKAKAVLLVKYSEMLSTQAQMSKQIRSLSVQNAALVAKVERLTKELEAYKYVVNAVGVHIKQAAALFK